MHHSRQVPFFTEQTNTNCYRWKWATEHPRQWRVAHLQNAGQFSPAELKWQSGLPLPRRERAKKFGSLLPARRVRAQSAPPPTTHKKQNLLSSYLDFCYYRDDSNLIPHYYYYYPRVVLEELSQNGTIAFYYGLNSVHNHTVCTVYVVAVLKGRMPRPH